VSNPTGRSLSALWHDFDDDGWLDLYVANDVSDNVFYHNTGEGFEDISHPAFVADYRGAMGLAAGDWNDDGDDDLFITHWVAQENALYDSLLVDLGPPTDGGPAVRFMDAADMVGLGQIALQRVGWGTAFADFDSDGRQDLVVANGSTFETAADPKGLRPQASFLFWNRDGQAFDDLTPMLPALATPHVSRGIAVSDYDNDGDVDIAIVDIDGGVRLLRNDFETDANWLKLRLRARPDGREHHRPCRWLRPTANDVERQLPVAEQPDGARGARLRSERRPYRGALAAGSHRHVHRGGRERHLALGRREHDGRARHRVRRRSAVGRRARAHDALLGEPPCGNGRNEGRRRACGRDPALPRRAAL
jgi:hypothetical protein